MNVDGEKLLRTLVKVRLLEEQMREFCQDWLTTPVPWQNAVMAVEQYTRCAIVVVWPTEAKMKALNGTMVRWDDGLIAVVVKPGLPPEEHNATIVKESMHPLIDEAGDMSANPDETIELLFKSEVFGVGNGEADHVPVVMSEHLALIAAACLLVPARLRAGIKTEIAAGKSQITIAAELGVPEQYVSIAMSETIETFTAKAVGAHIDA